MTDDFNLDDGLVANLAKAEADYLASCRAIACLFDFLAHIEADWHDERPAARARALMGFYSDFISRVAGYPDADQDSLFRAAERVFHDRVAVMRRDLARAMQQATKL